MLNDAFRRPECLISGLVKIYVKAAVTCFKLQARQQTGFHESQTAFCQRIYCWTQQDCARLQSGMEKVDYLRGCPSQRGLKLIKTLSNILSTSEQIQILEMQHQVCMRKPEEEEGVVALVKV